MTAGQQQQPPPLPAPAAIKMIVADVDGTLLDSAHCLPPTSPTYRVLRRIRSQHPQLPIVISTGKQHRSTAQLREQLDLHAFPCCHLNGNVVYSSSPSGREEGEEAAAGRIVCESGLEAGVVGAVLREMAAADTSLFVYDHTTVYQLFRGCGDAGQWARQLRSYGELVVDDRDDVAEAVARGDIRPVKMAICQDPDTISEPIARLEAAFPPTAFALTSALPFCMELIPAAHNKGTALAVLLKHLNAAAVAAGRETLGAENVIAFGDGQNDVSMFGVAGMSVAMANAMDSARAAATWVTDSNDRGGVGTFLEQVFWPVPN